MKNLFKNTEFVFGVTDYKKLPKDIGNEILLAGRKINTFIEVDNL